MFRFFSTCMSRRFSVLALALILLVLPLAGCDVNETEEIRVADFGQTGSAQALRFAENFPFRSPGSEQEWAAGDYIVQALREMGYTPVVTTFEFGHDGENTMTSRNIAVMIEGSGFVRTDDAGNQTTFRRQVIVGAHYDTIITAEQAAAEAVEETATSPRPGIVSPTLADFNGIQDNASGVAALLTVAREMKAYQFGYDVILVAFGAGSSEQAGARFFASQMSSDEIAATDVMYCIDSIYAGDKIYAHAGRNSILGGGRKDYEKRRKLYEVTDVFYDNLLYTRNRFMLHTNQASFLIELENFAEPVVYREWTMNASDYVPFDELGIPIVFFESFDYSGKTMEAMKESQNPAFGATGGMIRGTNFDSSGYLEQLLNTSRAATDAENERPAADQLTRRINNTAFVILEAIAKGVPDAEAR